MRGYKVILAFLCVTAPFQAHGMQWSKELVKRYANGLTANKCADYIHKGATGLSNLIYFGYVPAIWTIYGIMYYNNQPVFEKDSERDKQIRTILRDLKYPENMTNHYSIAQGHYAADGFLKRIRVPEQPESEKLEIGIIAHEAAHIYLNHGLIGPFGTILSFFGIHNLEKLITKKWPTTISKHPLKNALYLLSLSLTKITFGLHYKLSAACLSAEFLHKPTEYHADIESIKRIKDPEVLDELVTDFNKQASIFKKYRSEDFSPYIPESLCKFLEDPEHPHPETRAAYFQKAADELRQKQELEQKNGESL